jgi:hypothetical protein
MFPFKLFNNEVTLFLLFQHMEKMIHLQAVIRFGTVSYLTQIKKNYQERNVQFLAVDHLNIQQIWENQIQ